MWANKSTCHTHTGDGCSLIVNQLSMLMTIIFEFLLQPPHFVRGRWSIPLIGGNRIVSEYFFCSMLWAFCQIGYFFFASFSIKPSFSINSTYGDFWQMSCLLIQIRRKRHIKFILETLAQLPPLFSPKRQTSPFPLPLSSWQGNRFQNTRGRTNIRWNR